MTKQIKKRMDKNCHIPDLVLGYKLKLRATNQPKEEINETTETLKCNKTQKTKMFAYLAIAVSQLKGRIIFYKTYMFC